MKSKVILVSIGGIGKPIDEIMLNKAKFDIEGVKLLGVIINKVQENKYDKINEYVRKGLEKKGIRVLGVIPHVDILSNPTVAELLEDLNGELLSEKVNFSNTISNFVIGDMAHDTLDYFIGNTLLIIPGNREKLILAALSEYILGKTQKPKISLIIFTNGIRPQRRIMNLLHQTQIPLLTVKEDSFSIALKINNMIFKLRSEDDEKIEEVRSLIKQYVDIDLINGLL